MSQESKNVGVNTPPSFDEEKQVEVTDTPTGTVEDKEDTQVEEVVVDTTETDTTEVDSRPTRDIPADTDDDVFDQPALTVGDDKMVLSDTIIIETPETEEEIQEDYSTQSNFNIDYEEMDYEDLDEVFHDPENHNTIEYGYPREPVKMTSKNLQMPDYIIKRKFRFNEPTVSVLDGTIRDYFSSLYRYEAESPSSAIIKGSRHVNESERHWYATATQALLSTSIHNDFYRYAMNDTSREFANGIKNPTSGKYIGIRSPQMSLDRARLTNQTAVEVVQRALNFGDKVHVFLPHSGFAVQLNAPTLSQFIELERKHMETNLGIGRSAKSLYYCHDTIHAYISLFDLFVSRVASTTLGDMDTDTLKSMISVMDLPVIAWALACAKFPNGIQMQIPCTAKQDTCTYIAYEVVNCKKLYLVDNAKLTARQLELASTSGTITPEMAEEYVTQFDHSEYSQIELSNNNQIKTIVHLATPSVAATFDSALSWIASISHAADTAFKTPLTGKDREEFIKSQAAATQALRYEHFVDHIEIVDDEGGQPVIIEDTVAIRQIIAGLTDDKRLYLKFINGVVRYINKAQVAFIGLPNRKCPQCGQYHQTYDESSVGHHLVPLDPILTFMTLCQQLTEPYLSDAEDEVTQTTT